MNKFLLALCGTAMCMSASAAEKTITFADLFTANVDFTEISYENFTFSADKASGTNKPAYNANGKDVRLYAKNTFTVTSSEPMTSISFEISSQGKKRLCEVVPSTGEFGEWTVAPGEVTWTGNAETITFTVDPNDGKAQYGSEGDSKAGQFDFLSVTIVTGEAGTNVSAPTFTPAPGTYYEPQTVTIASRTADASIYYAIGDGAFALYNGDEIEVEESTTIRAYAAKGDIKSEEVTAEYIIKELPTYNSLAEVLEATKDLANKAYSDPFIVGFEPVVTYVSGANTYVAENDAYCLIYKYDLGLKAGDKVAKGWSAQVQNFNGLMELVPASTAVVEANGTARIPDPVYIQSVSDINEGLVSAVVAVANVTFAEATPSTKATFTGTVADGDITFYNGFTLPAQDAGSYDVKAVVGYYNALQIQPIEFLTVNSINGVDVEEASVEYFNLQGMRIAAPAEGTVVIRRQGNSISKILVK